MNRGRWIGGVRKLCTAAADGPPYHENPDRLYRRLSALGSSGKSAAAALNDYMMEGRTVKKYELDSCVRELRRYRQFDHALEIMEWMEFRKINYALSDYAIRLDLTAKAKGIKAAESYFADLPDPVKNKWTYGSLLNCYCKEVMEEKALALYYKMNEMNHSNSALAFNNLMALYMRMNQPEKVGPFVAEMKRREIRLDTFSYNIWMQSCAALNDMTSVESILEEMQGQDGYRFDWSTFSNLASIYVKAQLYDKAEEALKMSEKVMMSWKPRRRSFHFLISLYANTGNLDEVKRIWELLNFTFPGTNNISHLVYAQALFKLKDVEVLKECFREWQSKCSSYDIRLVNVVIRAYLSQNMYEEALLLFKDATKRSRGPFFKARENFMIYHLENHQLDLAMSCFEEAILEKTDDKWRPSLLIITAFLKYFEETKDIDSSEIFCKILKHRNYLGSIEYCLLLNVYVTAGKSIPDIRQRLKEDTIQIGPELEVLVEKVSPSSSTL